MILTLIAGAVYGMQRDVPVESTAPYIEHVPDQLPAKEPKKQQSMINDHQQGLRIMKIQKASLKLYNRVTHRD